MFDRSGGRMKFEYQRFPFSCHDPRNPLIARPLLLVYLHGNGKKTRSPYFALLDSGAGRVIFPADLASEVGISKIETGRHEPAVGIAGQIADVFYHNLSIELLGDSRVLPTEVGFSNQVSLPSLGRSF